MDYLKFYKLYDWILCEMGASSDACIISIIQSFYDNGTECRLSYNQFADMLRISRRKAIDRIKRLEKDGYITIQGTGSQSNVYKVNRDSFKYPTSDENVTPPVTKTSPPSDENVTPPSDENVTQIENITENIKENQKERGRKRKAFTPPTLEEVKDYVFSNSLVVNPGKFFYQYEESNWKGVQDWQKRILKWNAEDKAKAGDQNSSFDLSEVEKLVNAADPYDWDAVIEAENKKSCL